MNDTEYMTLLYTAATYKYNSVCLKPFLSNFFDYCMLTVVEYYLCQVYDFSQV
jgi:hypothetical protein